MIDYFTFLLYYMGMEKKVFVAERNDKLANLITACGFSYNYAGKMIRNKDVKVDGVRVKDNINVLAGSEIMLFYEAIAKGSKCRVVFEDDNVVVVDKLSGVEVEGKDGLEGELNVYAVHRLDRNTEGLMILAKNKTAEAVLLKAFKEHSVEKRYLAEVVGATNFKGEVYKAFLFKDKETAYVKVQSTGGKGAQEIATGFKTLKSNPSSSIVECRLLTGKTHQLRAHLKFLGHPIIGDGKYGKNEDNKKFKQKHQQLYCYYLKFEKLDLPLRYLENKAFINYPEFYKK